MGPYGEAGSRWRVGECSSESRAGDAPGATWSTPTRARWPAPPTKAGRLPDPGGGRGGSSCVPFGPRRWTAKRRTVRTDVGRVASRVARDQGVLSQTHDPRELLLRSPVANPSPARRPTPPRHPSCPPPAALHHVGQRGECNGRSAHAPFGALGPPGSAPGLGPRRRPRVACHQPSRLQARPAPHRETGDDRVDCGRGTNLPGVNGRRPFRNAVAAHLHDRASPGGGSGIAMGRCRPRRAVHVH